MGVRMISGRFEVNKGTINIHNWQTTSIKVLSFLNFSTSYAFSEKLSIAMVLD